MIDLSRRWPILYKNFWLVLETLMYFLSFKYLVMALLLARYQTLQKNVICLEESERNYLNNSCDLFWLLTTLGCTYRAMGWTGVAVCLVYTAAILPMFVIEKLEKETMRKIYSGGVMGFLRDPERERRRLLEEIRLIITRLQISNCEFGSALRMAKPSDSIIAMAKVVHPTMLNMLSDQLNHLRWLKINQNVVQPPNRQLDWHRKILNWWLLSYLFMMCNTYFFGVPGTVLINWKSNQATESSSRPFTQMDQLDWTLEVLFPLVCIKRYSQPLSFILISFIDQNCHLGDIKSRLSELNRKLAHLRGKGRMTSYLRSELDYEALELYISFRVFSHESRRYFRQAQHSILQIFCTTLCPCISAISFSRQVDARLFFVLLMIVLYVSMNLCFYPAALLHHRILETTKLGWSLISQASDLVGPGLRNPISPHTLLLWQRLVQDYDKFAFVKASDIFSTVELNFGSILALNFYVLSAMVLFIRLFIEMV